MDFLEINREILILSRKSAQVGSKDIANVDNFI